MLSHPWLALIVTTRLNPQDFHLDTRRFRPIEISVLPPADALQLLRNYQPGQCFADVTEEATAAEIVRLLGGYTLAVELVAACLGDRAHQDYQPSHYLTLLDQQGPTTVDLLAQDAAVQAQVRHSPQVAQNHIAKLIGWSLERLSPAARTLLDFACLLMPDEIPLAWLEHLTQARHPETLAHEARQPAPWPAIWRALYGLRLLHPASDSTPDARGIERKPTTVRIHRLIASHVAAANTLAAQCFAELDQYLEALAEQFEHGVGQGEDAGLKAQHSWLRDQLSYLISHPAHPATPSLLRSAAVAADFEGEHGSLVQALVFTQRILQAKEVYLVANPQSTQAARDVSVSLNKLGDFLARRGLGGDAELALGCFERSLKMKEVLQVANSQSAQAARDVSVSLVMLGDFLAQRGLAGDAGQALGYFERGLKIREALLAANPQSAQAARDVSVSLERLGDFLAQRGHEEVAGQALGYFERSLKIRDDLLAANPQSAEAARDVSVSLNKLGDILARRGQEGDAEQALGYFERDLKISEALLAAHPQSAQAARDVSASLDKLGDFLAQRGREGDAGRALEYFERSLKIGEELLVANPQSAEAARDVSVSHFKMAHFHHQHGKREDAQTHLAHCFAILEGFAQAGRPMDVDMRQLHAQLKPLFQSTGE